MDDKRHDGLRNRLVVVGHGALIMTRSCTQDRDRAQSSSPNTGRDRVSAGRTSVAHGFHPDRPVAAGYRRGTQCDRSCPLSDDGGPCFRRREMTRLVRGADGRMWTLRGQLEWSQPATIDDFEHDVASGYTPGIVMLFMLGVLVV